MSCIRGEFVVQFQHLRYQEPLFIIDNHIIAESHFNVLFYLLSHSVQYLLTGNIIAVHHSFDA